MTSQFEQIVPEDFKQFREISKQFVNTTTTDIDGLWQLTVNGWLLATRWSEIQSNASLYAQKYEINKTDFSNWAYQKYRQLQELHITCRVRYKMAVEEFKANQIMEG